MLRVFGFHRRALDRPGEAWLVTQALIPREQYAALERCVYLNQASLGLVPRRSTEAMVDFLVDVAQYGNVRLSDSAEERILDELRQAAAGLFDAPLRSLAVVGGASEALGQLAILTAQAGGEVLLVASDFPSVSYPWLVARERFGTVVKWVKDDPQQDLTAALVAGIQSSTTAVCFSAVQFATGSLVDVGEVVRRAHAVGARVIVDVTQMAGAMAVSLRAWSADALVCSGYKWLSSHGGVALLAVTDELLQGVPPIVGWKGAQHPFQFDPTTLALATDARRFELSTIAYSSAAGLSASIELLTGIGFPGTRPTRRSTGARARGRECPTRLDAVPRPRRGPGQPSHRLTAPSHARREGGPGAPCGGAPDRCQRERGRPPRVPSCLQRQLRHRPACCRLGQRRPMVAYISLTERVGVYTLCGAHPSIRSLRCRDPRFALV